MKKYIVLEPLDEPSIEKDEMIIYVINFLSKRIVDVGFGPGGLQINNSSVSQQHAQFRIWNVYDPEIK